MSFFSKLKQFAGIGTVDVRLQAPAHFSATDTQLAGTLHLTAKSDQQVLGIVVELREEFRTGRDDDKKEQRFVLGSVQLPEGFFMRAGETRTVAFALPVAFRKSDNARLQERGGLLGGIGKLGAWAADEQSAFKLHATVDVKGTPLDPVAETDLKLVG